MHVCACFRIFSAISGTMACSQKAMVQTLRRYISLVPLLLLLIRGTYLHPGCFDIENHVLHFCLQSENWILDILSGPLNM